MTKALFFDIDGTLVSFKTHKIPESTLQAVRAARRNGLKVFIATGRPRPFIDNLGSLEYDGIICVNGASILSTDGTVLYSQPVPLMDVQRMVTYLQAHPLAVVFAGNTETCIVHPNEPFREVFDLLNLSCPPVRPAEYALNMDVLQIIAFFPKTEEAALMEHVLTHCEANRWHPAFADCIVKGTNKATAIDRVCQHYGWDISEVMAFGDGGNDKNMLIHAGIGVAMGNARDEVKACADYVTTPVDEDGIANALRHFQLID